MSKPQKTDLQPSPLTLDSQNRLLAYTTAAGLGAFFAGQNVEAQVTESTAFAPYPATLLPQGGTNAFGFYNFFSIDGGTNADFNLNIGKPFLPNPSGGYYNQFIDLVGQTNDVGELLAQVLTPTTIPDVNGHTNNAYAVCFLGGSTINADTASPPWYQPRLEISYLVANNYGGFYNYIDNKYISTGAIGFSFIGSADGQTHFGYMDVQVNTTTNTVGSTLVQIVKSVAIKDIYYNATPNAGITVPIVVGITNIAVAPGNAITINFTSNDNADPSTFILETSPTLGAGANWTADPLAVISQTLAANPAGGVNVATYQAVTIGTGGPAQFYRIQH